MKKISVFALCALVMVTGCKMKPQIEEEQREELVEVAPLTASTVERVLSLSTTLEGYQKMDIAPSVTGRIEHIYTEVGTRVSTGSNLVRMDQNQYTTTKLTYTNLQQELARMEALVATGAISKQTYDQTKLSFDQTAESLRFLEENTYVKAKFPGVISAKNYEDGELYSGQAILTLTQINVLKALVNVPESYFPLVHKGMSVDVLCDIYPGETFKGSIDIVYPTIDPASHTFQVRIRIPNGGERLRPGMYAYAKLALGKVEAMVLPYQSVQKLTGSNERYIYVNDNGVARRVFVKLGERYDDKIEIESDELNPGEEIVVTGAEKLVDGVKLKINR
ncbi:MAG: efflux RND transporter periplasmic adaptor subunit [Bacteroidales bacterium]|jgi:RND family efflux transporter MFP subunit|nr:efflux RND transporter periplasmic adaptor subunit [Bacteroidales bacterium]